MSVMALFSFFGNFGVFVDGYLAINNVENHMMWAVLVQWVIILIAVVLIVVFLHSQIEWLYTHPTFTKVWRFIWIIPASTLFTNVFMVPEDYATFKVGRVFIVGVVILINSAFFFCIFQTIFYLVLRNTYDSFEMKEKAQLLDIQSMNYSKLQDYVAQTRRMRHDFRHTVGTVMMLAENDRIDDLKRFLSEYNGEFLNVHAPTVFCRNSAINAILSYYVEIAMHNFIDIKWNTVRESVLPR